MRVATALKAGRSSQGGLVMSSPRSVNEDCAGCADALGYGGGKEGSPDLENIGRNRGKR